MRLPFDADKAIFEEWEQFHIAQVDNKEFFFIDINDAKMIFLTAHEIYKKYPEKIDLLKEHTPQAVENAMKELGMFMGVHWLCNKVEVDPKEGEQLMMGLYGK